MSKPTFTAPAGTALESVEPNTTPTSISIPKLFAHRGTSLLAPENTSAAFDLAVAYQADVLETDVRLSRDGVVMVTHDDTLQRTTNGLGRVRDHSLQALKKLDASVGFRGINGEPYEGEFLSLLTLDELFEQYPHVGINIDIKDNDPAAAEAVADVITRRQRGPTALPWTNVGSFHAQVTQRFRQLAPDVSTAATRQEVARLVFGRARQSTPSYKILQIPISYWGIKLNGNRLIEKVHAMGCDVAYWTINDAKQISNLLNTNCDGVVTDRPDLALAEYQRLGYK